MPLQLCNFPMPRVLHKSLEYKCSLFAHFICVTHGRRPPRIVDRTSFCACGPNCAALLSQLMWIDCADLLNNPRVSLCCIMIVALGQIGHFSQTQITGARWMPYSYYYSQKKTYFNMWRLLERSIHMRAYSPCAQIGTFNRYHLRKKNHCLHESFWGVFNRTVHWYHFFKHSQLIRQIYHTFAITNP